MKRYFVILATILVASTTFAQTKEEIKASVERAQQISELLAKTPKSTGIANVDGCVNDLQKAAEAAVANSENLTGLYYREIGETKDGVTDVNVKKPTLDELLQLSESITEEGTAVTEAGKKVEPAINEIKEIKNPMKAAKLVSVTNFITDLSKILGEESVAQAKAIAEMIETAKSASNL